MQGLSGMAGCHRAVLGLRPPRASTSADGVNEYACAMLPEGLDCVRGLTICCAYDLPEQRTPCQAFLQRFRQHNATGTRTKHAAGGVFEAGQS